MKTQLTQRMFYFTATVALSVMLSANVSAQTMNALLTQIIPADDPYCVESPAEEDLSPCANVLANNGVGAEGGDSAMPDSVVDWVLVELRTGADADAAAGGGDAIVARKPALLLSNGRVVDAEEFLALTSPDTASCVDDTDSNTNNVADNSACPALTFDDAAFGSGSVTDGDYYIVVHHRNHIPVMSSNNVAVNGSCSTAGDCEYDFTTAASQARGSALKSKSGTVAMIGGDANANGFVQPNDISLVIQPAQGAANQYLAADTNMNAAVQPNDISLVAQPNQGSAIQFTK